MRRLCRNQPLCKQKAAFAFLIDCLIHNHKNMAGRTALADDIAGMCFRCGNRVRLRFQRKRACIPHDCLQIIMHLLYRIIASGKLYAECPADNRYSQITPAFLPVRPACFIAACIRKGHAVIPAGPIKIFRPQADHRIGTLLHTGIRQTERINCRSIGR